MTDHKLHPKAWVALLLTGLYAAAEALCSIFVSVYLWVNSQDFGVVCRHYLALFIVIPFVFLLAGWYSQARDRLHVYRLGLVLHAVYYATLLYLQEQSPQYAVHLGALLGVTWGVYYAGANTFSFDVTHAGKRELYFGLLQSINGGFRLVAPLIGSLIIWLSTERLNGYHRLFAVAIGIYIVCFLLSFQMPSDNERRPFRIKRALFPGKDQRDWRLIMLAATTLAGNYIIFTFLLGLMMYQQTGTELSVGPFASVQAVAGIVTAFALGRLIVPRNRKTFLRAGALLLFLGGLVISFKLTVTTLIIFGLLQAVARPLFGIPHFSLRFDTISQCIEEPGQRIEYICAWEIPLAVGRILMMLALMGLYGWLQGNELGIRCALLLLCTLRLLTYLILSRTDSIRSRAAQSFE